MDYAAKARAARIAVLGMIHRAGSSHIGSNYSAIDLLTVLFEHMDTKKDEFICSKGWIAASVYYFLEQKGIIPEEDLKRYCMPNEEIYIGLVEPQNKWGLRAAGGAVGYGLSFGVGFALSKKLNNSQGNVYILMSDGEMDCGMIWESAKVAVKYKLDNLVAIIDNNKFQATGTKNEVLPTGNLYAMWKNIGWDVIRLNGHNYVALEAAITGPRIKPQVLICDTIKGQGVSWMEGQLQWHYRNVDDEHYKKALLELSL